MSDFVRPARDSGVFETFLVVDGSPLELAAHLERLAESVRELFGEAPPAHARELALESASDLAIGRMRLTVAPDARGLLTADVRTARVDPADIFPAWERAIDLRPMLVAGGLGAHKWADRTALARAESEAPAGSLPLLLDADEEVLEASRANVFAVRGDALLTPAADGRILLGTARARAIEAARSLGVEVREQAFTLAELLAAGEAFLTGSVRGLEPVRSVDGQQLARPGELARDIAAWMRRLWLGADQRSTPAASPGS